MAYESGIMVLGEVDGGGKLTASARALCGIAAGLGPNVTAALIGANVNGAAEELASLGPSKVLLIEDPALANYLPEVYLPLAAGLCEPHRPGLILLAHSTVGQDLAPQLCHALEGSAVTDCIGISEQDGVLTCSKPIYGGNVIAGLRSKSDPLVVTVRAGTGEAPAPGPTGTVEVVDADIPTASKVVFVERLKESGEEVSLEDAPVVVSGGRGMGGPDGFAELSKLAGLFGGAVGASRPPVDSGWVNAMAQVGITGKIVSPELYIAVALSGSSQHLSGMADSRTVVAINNDPDAYVFKVSDYGAVGDWKKVLPAFTSKLAGLLEGGE